MFAEELVPVETVTGALSYDPKTGLFAWRHRSDMPNNWNRRFAGQGAGHVRPDRRVVIRIANKQRFAHRLAWVMVHGRWPTQLIDHRDGDVANNRIENLRECNQAENQQNRAIRRDNRSGLIGVSFNNRERKWVATIGINYKQIYLGRFETREEAHSAFLNAKSEHHLFEPNIR